MIPIPALFGSFGWQELLIVAFVVLLLFGPAKIPGLMRGIGQGISEFRRGLRDADASIRGDRS
jgi:sec-independent protein translocase protein TatA